MLLIITFVNAPIGTYRPIPDFCKALSFKFKFKLLTFNVRRNVQKAANIPRSNMFHNQS